MKNTTDAKRYGLDKDAHAVLDGELVLLNEFGGVHAYETEKNAPATPEAVFELFNGTITAIENEANARAAYGLDKYGDVPFSEQNVLKLVDAYDEFINQPDFKLDVFSVRKLDMENFWAANKRKAPFKVAGKAVSYGKSTVYAVRRGKRVVMFLLNNMTYDGQNSYALTSAKAGAAARACFKGTGRYPSEIRKEDGTRNRWARVLDELDENDGNTANAWSILESNDSKFFYGELKRHNGVDKAMRQQLKAVRRAAGGLTFDLYVESLKERKTELDAKFEDTGLNVDEELELDAIEAKLVSYNEEHNSDEAVSVFEDYDNWNYYENNEY